MGCHRVKTQKNRPILEKIIAKTRIQQARAAIKNIAKNIAILLPTGCKVAVN
jgi:hypothetical protein